MHQFPSSHQTADSPQQLKLLNIISSIHLASLTIKAGLELPISCLSMFTTTSIIAVRETKSLMTCGDPSFLLILVLSWSTAESSPVCGQQARSQGGARGACAPPPPFEINDIHSTQFCYSAFKLLHYTCVKVCFCMFLGNSIPSYLWCTETEQRLLSALALIHMNYETKIGIDYKSIHARWKT